MGYVPYHLVISSINRMICHKLHFENKKGMHIFWLHIQFLGGIPMSILCSSKVSTVFHSHDWEKAR